MFPITLRLAGGELGDDPVFVRCLLTTLDAPIELCIPHYEAMRDWQETGYTSTDCNRRLSSFVLISKQLIASCFNVPIEDFECEIQLYLRPLTRGWPQVVSGDLQ